MILSPFELRLLRELAQDYPRAWGAAVSVAYERIQGHGLLDRQFRLTPAGRIAAELAEPPASAELAAQPRAFTED